MLIRQRRHGSIARRGPPVRPAEGPTKGPRPTNYTALISRTMGEPSWTYALRYGASDLWKIGHAQNVDARIAEVNKHIPHELTGDRWQPFARVRWPDSLAAYEMEQRLFAALSEKRTQGERVRCPAEDLIAAWRICSSTHVG